jgi:small subunit ribosomal protein S3
MGQKVHPHGLRLGIIRTWESRWFARKGYADLVVEDAKIRSTLKKKLFHAALSKIDIERSAGKVTVNLFSARPGIIIGKKGSEVDVLRAELKKLTGKEVFINIREIKNAEIDAQLIAENVAGQLERRVGFRRAMKKAMQTTMAMGAKGIKIICRDRPPREVHGGQGAPPHPPRQCRDRDGHGLHDLRHQWGEGLGLH